MRGARRRRSALAQITVMALVIYALRGTVCRPLIGRASAQPTASPAPAPQPPASPAPQPPASPTAAPIALLQHPLVGTTDLYTVIAPSWRSTTARMRRWHRDRNGTWRAQGKAWRVVIGKSGLAWGDGLHGHGAPAEATTQPPVPALLTSPDDARVKAEGDGATPAGVFTIDAAFGAAAKSPSHLPYQATNADWLCIDDPASTHYNRIINRSDARATATPDWQSAETMLRNDGLYELVVTIGHNPTAVAGAGSCIFLHVWRNAAAPTVGCIAMPLPTLRTQLGTMTHDTRLVVLPSAVYRRFQRPWDLP